MGPSWASPPIVDLQNTRNARFRSPGRLRRSVETPTMLTAPPSRRPLPAAIPLRVLASTATVAIAVRDGWHGFIDVASDAAQASFAVVTSVWLGLAKTTTRTVDLYTLGCLTVDPGLNLVASHD